MKTTIHRFGGGPITLAAFADQHNLEMVITERSRVVGCSRFYARFKGVEVMERGCLASAFGDGSTPDAAIADYAKQIAGQRLAHLAYTSGRREFEVPNEFLSE